MWNRLRIRWIPPGGLREPELLTGSPQDAAPASWSSAPKRSLPQKKRLSPQKAAASQGISGLEVGLGNFSKGVLKPKISQAHLGPGRIMGLQFTHRAHLQSGRLWGGSSEAAVV